MTSAQSRRAVDPPEAGRSPLTAAGNSRAGSRPYERSRGCADWGGGGGWFGLLTRGPGSHRPSYISQPDSSKRTQERGPFWGSLAAVIGGFLIATYGAFLAFLPPLNWLAYQSLSGGRSQRLRQGGCCFFPAS